MAYDPAAVLGHNARCKWRPEEQEWRSQSSWCPKWKWNSLSHVWLFVIPRNSPGQNTGVGSLSFLQGIFPTQGSNPGLLHCWWILYQLSHKGSPRRLKWVASPFSSGFSWPRDKTRVSCITGGFLTNRAIREALDVHGLYSLVLPSSRLSEK